MTATMDAAKMSDPVDSDGNTMLHDAISHGYWRIAKYLLGLGANIMAVNQATRSAFSMTLEVLPLSPYATPLTLS